MSTPSITVVLTIYRRPANAERVFAELLAQTPGVELFVWANPPAAAADLPDGAGWEVQSGRNEGCAPRWWMAAQAQTPYVAIIDDDLYPADARVLADVAAWLAANPGVACAAEGKRLFEGLTYRQCPNVKPACVDQPADVLKGRFLAVETSRLRDLPSWLPRFEDDIAASSFLGGGVVPSCLRGRFKELPTGPESVCRRPEHFEGRERARRRWCV